jgi:ribonuclease E
MAIKRMLVDAIHPEETRVVVTSGSRLEEFDFESASRRQLRGNIYLAKVTRVEPSLQAAFVEYGGNRHGFLAFSEIHPDYYQIPVADREALLKAEAADHADDHHDDQADIAEQPGNGDAGADAEPEDHDAGNGNIEQAPASNEPIESMGGADALEEVPERRQRNQMRRYKIQEVIKRRQVMLVQVVKEERGNKGAALTTYLSLAGRYSVLMPNTARGGGISRKITNAADRKRLKEITSDLEVPPGMGVILRTAGASRTKAEVKRDFEYLMRLWENVRTLTLKSVAPCLVYEEGSLIKRTIRDLYSKDIEEVLVAGDDAYREAKDFMKMIMPSHAKNVKPYAEDQAIFSKYNVEQQLDQMFSPQVTLPSGGYIVINPTEALVSIDVNSGRSTKEHNIEDTALQTNLEAAEEVARQLRLRDLAGLIVIDFIDMMENRSNRAVERKLKDCLKDDRARIQVGRISHFGLMEMSRQRIRFGVLESSTHKCPICDGTGLVRSTESLALAAMRHVEDHVLRKPGQSINVRVPVDIALYILNFKRETLVMLESKHGLSITITADGKLIGHQFSIERGESRAPTDLRPVEHVRVDSAVIDDEPEDEAIEETEDEAEDAPVAREAAAIAAGTGEAGSRRGRRRRRRRNGERTGDTAPRELETAGAELGTDAEGDEADGEDAASDGAPEAARADSEAPRRRRRGRRGGRRNRREGGELEAGSDIATDAEAASDAAVVEEPTETATDALPAMAEVPAQADEAAAEAPAAEEKPKRRTARRRKPGADAPTDAVDVPAEAPQEPVADGSTAEEPAAEKPKRRSRTRKIAAEAAAAPAEPAVSEAAVSEKAPAAAEPEPAAPAAEPAPAEPERPKRARKVPPAEGIVVTSSAPPSAEETTEAEPDKKKKVGWWQRRLGLG